MDQGGDPDSFLLASRSTRSFCFRPPTSVRESTESRERLLSFPGPHSLLRPFPVLFPLTPKQVPIAHAEEVEQVFDAISYCKGACVVKMLNAVLGMDMFKKGLQVMTRCTEPLDGLLPVVLSFLPVTRL